MLVHPEHQQQQAPSKKRRSRQTGTPEQCLHASCCCTTHALLGIRLTYTMPKASTLVMLAAVALCFRRCNVHMSARQPCNMPCTFCRHRYPAAAILHATTAATNKQDVKPNWVAAHHVSARSLWRRRHRSQVAPLLMIAVKSHLRHHVSQLSRIQAPYFGARPDATTPTTASPDMLQSHHATGLEATRTHCTKVWHGAMLSTTAQTKPTGPKSQPNKQRHSAAATVATIGRLLL